VYTLFFIARMNELQEFTEY